jgi:hypothetical protein
MLLASRHLPLLLFQFVSPPLAQIEPGTPLIHADTGVHPELLNSRFGYVSVSRATHEAVIFTNDAGRLNQHVGAEITKTSALQISEPSDTIREIGMTI